MRKYLFSIHPFFLDLLAVCAILLSSADFSSAQVGCPFNIAYNEGGTVTPDACGFQQVSIGSGTYVTANVHNGGRYEFNHCNATNWSDDEVTGYQVGSGV